MLRGGYGRRMAVSLGFRTDLMLLRMQGSTVQRRQGYVVARTPDNPTYYWGNFLLLDEPPRLGTVGEWIETFRREIPEARHIALGVDSTDGAAGDRIELAAAALGIESSTVLTAQSVTPPPRPNRTAELRRLDGDEDWRKALDLRLVAYKAADDRSFAERQMAAQRRLQEAGRGSWFGAFDGGRMVSGLGVFTDGQGVGRYQSVDTHPEHRRQGLAGTLVHLAGRYALDVLGVRTLVIVADPAYHAIKIYRSVGFTDTETQIQLQRTPPRS